MGMVMIKCPQTGLTIPTGIKTDRESFGRSPVFFARTRCPICQTDHTWFAPEAWVDEPSTWGAQRSLQSVGYCHDTYGVSNRPRSYSRK